MEPVTINGLLARFKGLGLFGMPTDWVVVVAAAAAGVPVATDWVPGTFVRASSALWMK